MLSATIGKLAFVARPSNREPTDYAKRVAFAMAEAQPPVTKVDLAKAAEVSFQAVSQLLTGSSKAFGVEAHAKAARFLKVDAYWLATGVGSSKLAQPNVPMLTAPFTTTTPEAAVAMSIIDEVADATERRRLLSVLYAVRQAGPGRAVSIEPALPERDPPKLLTNSGRRRDHQTKS